MGLPVGDLPFRGVDVWNHYEFTWLNQSGKPQVARARFLIPADSASLIESKSMKLYLGSFAETRFRNMEAVLSVLETDLSSAAGGKVQVCLASPEIVQQSGLSTIRGRCLDGQQITITDYDRNPGLLESGGKIPIRESLYSNLLRSLCPMTGQPDHGCVQISYRGLPIDHEGLLRYIVSYRRHLGFGEQIAERMFLDIMRRCAVESLSVFIHYTRRGGIDINPLRTTESEMPAGHVRLWWQ